MIQHQTFEHNKHGIDYFVGDLHGHYSLLMRELDSVGFDDKKDRLFATGDIIDRGPEPLECVGLLDQKWFNSVIGNHEQMLILGLDDSIARKLHLRNGGGWIERLSSQELELIASKLKERMSLAMTIDTAQGKVGVIHAEAPSDWLALNDPVDRDLYLWPTEQYHVATSKRSKPVANIDITIHGHVNCSYVTEGRNQLWIDTLVQSGRLTVLSTAQAFNKLQP
ncbi:MAG: protein phosphatase [Oceanospirillales bacterium]|nr:protein phosphatase [Oceanospirillales bacterium]